MRFGKYYDMVQKYSLKGLRIAILATDGFEQPELLEPRKALEDAGARVEVVAPAAGKIQGFKPHDKGDAVQVDVVLSSGRPADYAALLMPGGALNADELRAEPAAVAFAKAFFDDDKPVAAICHAFWTLVESGVLAGRTLTSWPSIQTDIRNAGGTWVDREVVVDGNFISSRKPDDIPAFNAKMLETFARAGQPQPVR